MPIADPSLLRLVADLAITHLEAVAARPAGPRASVTDLRATLGGPLPAGGTPPQQVIEELVRDADRGLVASPGPRYFGFVTGGALPAALAADWLASAWDQNGFTRTSSPAAAAIETVAERWVLEALALPADAAVGFATGATASNFTGLAAA